MINIYTDGSCINNKGGWAYIIVAGEDKIISNSGRSLNTTNNRMELTACLKAIEKVIELGYNHDNCILYTDSQYVITTVCGDRKFFQTNQDLISLVRDKKCFVNIEFKWVKAHNGNWFNESVDIMARQKAQNL